MLVTDPNLWKNWILNPDASTAKTGSGSEPLETGSRSDHLEKQDPVPTLRKNLIKNRLFGKT